MKKLLLIALVAAWCGEGKAQYRSDKYSLPGLIAHDTMEPIFTTMRFSRTYDSIASPIPKIIDSLKKMIVYEDRKAERLEKEMTTMIKNNKSTKEASMALSNCYGRLYAYIDAVAIIETLNQTH